MQDTIRAGDTLDYTTTLADYPASAGWVLTYRLIPRTSGTAITITGSASGDDHRTAASATTTAAWTAGDYSWVAYVTLASERYTVDSGTVKILPDLASAAAYDNRSQAQTALDEAKAALATFQSTGGRVRSYSIGGRSMEYADETALLKAISYWQVQVKIEEARNRKALGLDDGRRIYLRVGNA